MSVTELGEGRYRVLGVLGHGGMGTVYHCRDTATGSDVAVKELVPPSGRAADERIEQFHDEARFLASLWHPCLPRVHGTFEEGGRYYIVMERVEGVTMRAHVETHGPPPREKALGWLDRLLDVIGFLHAQQPPIIFRDVSPDNVMVSERGLKLIDFGLARQLLPDAGTRPALRGWGSPSFAAPEQYTQRGTSVASDLYGVAATAFWLFSGELPSEAVERLVSGDDALEALRPHTQAPLRAWVRRGMALEPARRFASAEEMRLALLDLPTTAKHVTVDPQRQAEQAALASGRTAATQFLDVLRTRLGNHGWQLDAQAIEPFSLTASRRVDLRMFHGLLWLADVLDEDTLRAAAALAQQQVQRFAGLLPSAVFLTLLGCRVPDPEVIARLAHNASTRGLRACILLPVDLQRGHTIDLHVPEDWRNTNDPGDFVLNVRIAAGGGLARL